MVLKINDTTAVAIASDELVTRKACYYASCYDLLNADDLLKFAVARSSGSKRIDIVFDVYREKPSKK